MWYNLPKGGIALKSWGWLFVVAFSAIAYTVGINLFRIFRLKRIETIYRNYIGEAKQEPVFTEFQQELISLFKDANLQDKVITYAENAGYGMLVPQSISCFCNAHFINPEVCAFISSSFSRARGVFRRRIFNAVNPLMWIHTIVFLPRAVLTYLKVAPEKVLVRILQVVWWLVAPVVVVFRNEILKFIGSLF